MATTFNQKLQISLGSAILFALLNFPETYRLTNSLLPFTTFDSTSNCPTYTGVLLHTLVFFLLTFFMMGDVQNRTGIKLKHSLYGTLIFFLISSPALYSLVGSIFGNQVASVRGCPTILGVFFHALVYAAVLVGIMYLPESNQ